MFWRKFHGQIAVARVATIESQPAKLYVICRLMARLLLITTITTFQYNQHKLDESEEPTLCIPSTFLTLTSILSAELSPSRVFGPDLGT